MSEAQDQAAVIQWARYQRRKWPVLDLLHGDMQGVKLNIGQAVKAKAQGSIRGWPDLFLPVARCEFHGLFIELKVGKNKMSPDQLFIQHRLTDEGYLCVMCVGADAAIKQICSYLES